MSLKSTDNSKRSYESLFIYYQWLDAEKSNLSSINRYTNRNVKIKTDYEMSKVTPRSNFADCTEAAILEISNSRHLRHLLSFVCLFVCRRWFGIGVNYGARGRRWGRAPRADGGAGAHALSIRPRPDFWQTCVLWTPMSIYGGCRFKSDNVNRRIDKVKCCRAFL